MRFGSRMVSVAITYSYIHPLLNRRMVAKVGNIFASSFESIMESAKNNLEYEKV